MFLTIDVHGMSVDQAIKEIQKIIRENPKCYKIEVIHGHNHGQAIKKRLQSKNNIHNKRVTSVLSSIFNKGITEIYLSL